MKWMNERPKELVSFLLDISNLNENDDQTAIWVNKCIEQIYSIKHKTSFTSRFQTKPYIFVIQQEVVT